MVIQSRSRRWWWIRPGRNSAVTVGRDGAIFVWDLETGTKVLTLNVHADDIFDASFSSTGEFLVTASRDQTARVWRVPAATTTLSRTNVGAETRTIDVDSKAKLVVLGSYDGTVALVDTNTLKRLASAKISKRAVTLVKFNEQANQVLLGSEDGSVALYSIPKLERLYHGMTDNSEIAGGYFTKTGFSVLTMGGSTYGYDGTTLSQVRHHNYDFAFTIVPAGDDRALVAGAKGATRIIDNVSGRTIVELEGHGGTVLHAVFDPGGSIVVTASEDGTGIVWNAVTGDELNVSDGPSVVPSFVALSEDGRYVAIASLDRRYAYGRWGRARPWPCIADILLPCEPCASCHWVGWYPLRRTVKFTSGTSTTIIPGPQPQRKPCSRAALRRSNSQRLACGRSRQTGAARSHKQRIVTSNPRQRVLSCIGQQRLSGSWFGRPSRLQR